MSIYNIFPRLETDRLILRDLRNADRAAIFRIYSDDVVSKFNPLARAQNVGDAEDIISYIRSIYRERLGIVWGVSTRENGTIIGLCGFVQWFRAGIDGQRAELGFVLARPYWGQGYMREACARVLTFGFETMALHRIEINVTPDNAPTLTFLEKFGFVPEGVLRDRMRYEDSFRDVVHLSLLHTDWQGV